MHEATQITYQGGSITIIMESESTYEVSAPDIRFGDYAEAAMACFTDKELEQIADGATAEVTFEIKMSEILEDTEALQQFQEEVELREGEMGNLHPAIYFEIDANKSIDNGEVVPIRSFDTDVEVQYDIPLYLVRQERSYYAITNYMGACEFLPDADEDADTFSVSTHSAGTMLLLYQDSDESLRQQNSGFQFKSQHLFIGGIVVLALIWWLVDRVHKKEK